MGVKVRNDAWYNELPEFMLEGYWACKIGSTDNGVYDKYITSVNVPQMNIEYEVTNYGLVKPTGKAEYGEGTFEFVDDINGTMNANLDGWLREIFTESANNFTGYWRSKCRDIVVEYYRYIGGEVIPIIQYELLGCYPKGVSDVTADGEGGDRKSYSFTFILQKSLPHFGKENITSILDTIHSQLA